MKQSIIIILLSFSLNLVTAQTNTEVTTAKVSFVFPNNDVKGTLSNFISLSSIDLENIENSTFKGSVDVETIDTGNSIRNWSLRRSNYFDADQYPAISFESHTVQKQENGFKVRGKLTIKNSTKDVTFIFKRSQGQLVGKTTLYSSDYGISIKKDREKNKVLVTIELQLK